MSKPNMAALVKDVQLTLAKHSPAILTGIGIAGMVTTTVLAVKATPKALDLIEDRKEELDMSQREQLPVSEAVKVAWKCYIPAAITGVMSVSCLIGASSVNSRRNAALTAAYNLSATALSEYKEKVIETVGEKKEKVIRDKVAEENLNKNPAKPQSVIITGGGTTRCFDMVTKRRFNSDIDTLNRIANELNSRMLRGDDYISLNEFYYELGLDGCLIGDELGWNVSNGLIEIDPSAQLDTDGVPCIVIDFVYPPTRGYCSYR